jgi:hypothetical protein
MNEPGPIRFPAPKPRDAAIKLALPRRRPGSARSSVDVLDASAAARESINALFSTSRTPFSGSKQLEASKLVELERTLRQLELSLAERERVIADTENRLVERERDVAEMEALLFAREQLIAASHHPESVQREISLEEKKALEHLRAELERQEAHLKEQKQFVRERELFLDESENKLFDKVQAQQDKENELEQREEDLLARDRRVREREAAIDPKAAAKLQAEDQAARKRDDFKE